jgi:ATPase subunit of ABC transporter with duplicated ATPase domains
MKKIRFILIALFLISLGALSQPAGAQEKSKEEKEKELRMQEEIDAQKKAFSEQKKAQEEAQKAIQESQKEVDKALKEAQEQVEAASKYKDMVKAYRGTGDRPYFNVEPFEGEPFIFSPGMEGLYGFSHSGDNERTTWDFSKSVKENSFSRDYTFDVEPTVKTVVMSINGDCKAGEIRIKIVMPNGKVYSDITIDEFGNLNWRKSFTISEEENKDKAGAWKFQINASKATGYFKISLQAF